MQLQRMRHPGGIEIVRTYADHGRSGLTLARRKGLRNLLDDVTHGRHEFSPLLVYNKRRFVLASWSIIVQKSFKTMRACHRHC